MKPKVRRVAIDKGYNYSILRTGVAVIWGFHSSEKQLHVKYIQEWAGRVELSRVAAMIVLQSADTLKWESDFGLLACLGVKQVEADEAEEAL